MLPVFSKTGCLQPCRLTVFPLETFSGFGGERLGLDAIALSRLEGISDSDSVSVLGRIRIRIRCRARGRGRCPGGLRRRWIVWGEKAD